MAKAKRKFYVVWAGRQTGVFTSWDECNSQVHKYPGGLHESFGTRLEAERAYLAGPSAGGRSGPPASPSQPAARAPRLRRERGERPYGATARGPILESISVDASCPGNPGPVEYQGVHTGTGDVVFAKGPFAGGTNNIGEFLAVVTALRHCAEQGLTLPIYTDSKTALSWRKKKRCNTASDLSQYPLLAEEVYQAERWLDTHKGGNWVRKWKTHEWGEIPADYGRK